MTEEGAKRILRDYRVVTGGFIDLREAIDIAIQALEEIQQIKEIISNFPLDCGSPVEDIKEIYRQLRGFLQIGTIEEFKALKEKSVAKKVKGISLTHEGRVGNCPVCGKFVRHQEQMVYCSCEQKLDWSE